MIKVKRSAQLNPGPKNTQNEVFTCSEQLPEDLSQGMHCTVLTDRPSESGRTHVSHNILAAL
ncbi:hypothetical protein Syun_029873 [Stephania yunnanensis]|uniref:Uncharacterized protein n=1 Tax=Stephania yunnanensis TaxID=152371 RepID=A0AAP0HHN9_9MAGN